MRRATKRMDTFVASSFPLHCIYRVAALVPNLDPPERPCLTLKRSNINSKRATKQVNHYRLEVFQLTPPTLNFTQTKEQSRPGILSFDPSRRSHPWPRGDRREVFFNRPPPQF